MSRMDEAMQELVDAIKFSEEYIRYQDIKNRVHNQPQLEQQIHAFRHKNYLLQNSDGNVDLYDATDKMEQEYREFRKNPLVAEYLAAENAFCRVVQKVNWTLIEELDFEVFSFLFSFTLVLFFRSGLSAFFESFWLIPASLFSFIFNVRILYQF